MVKLTRNWTTDVYTSRKERLHCDNLDIDRIKKRVLLWPVRYQGVTAVLFNEKVEATVLDLDMIKRDVG